MTWRATSTAWGPATCRRRSRPARTYDCTWSGQRLRRRRRHPLEHPHRARPRRRGHPRRRGRRRPTSSSSTSSPTSASSSRRRPSTMPEPGGPVTFTVTLVNDSHENVTIDSFVDAPYGDLNGQGTCRLPQTLTPNGGFYTCTFRETVTGTAADSPYVDTVTAAVSDNEGNRVDEAPPRPRSSSRTSCPASASRRRPSPRAARSPAARSRSRSRSPTPPVEPVTAVRASSMTSTATSPRVREPGPHGHDLRPAPAPRGRRHVQPARSAVSFTGNPAHPARHGDSHGQRRRGQPGHGHGRRRPSPSPTCRRPSTSTKTATPTSLPEPGGPVAFTFGVTQHVDDRPPDDHARSDTVFGTLTGDADCRVGTVLPIGASCAFSQTFTVTGSAASGPALGTRSRARGRDDERPRPSRPPTRRR